MFKRVGILGRFGGASGASNPELLNTIKSIIRWLEDLLPEAIYVHADTVKDFQSAFDDAHKWSNSPQRIVPASDHELDGCDAVVVVGGDGTMLHAVQMLTNPVLIGVNLGRVGFITDIPAKHAGGIVSDLVRDPSLGKLREYSLLSCAAAPEGWTKMAGFQFRADRIMNDIVITRATSKLLELEVYVRQAHAFHVRGDGLLVSTPMGSTAYSLAAGGSIMAPGADLLQIVPMMPQTLAHRPLIVSGDDLDVRVVVKNGTAKVEADGKQIGTLNKGQQIEIEYEETVRILRSPGYSYYDTLRTKLNWHLEAGTKPYENY